MLDVGFNVSFPKYSSVFVLASGRSFSAITVGFVEQGRIHQYLPPQPPPVHYSVYECLGDELVRFTEATDFFRTLLFAYQIPSDELLAAEHLQLDDGNGVAREPQNAYLPEEQGGLPRAKKRRPQPGGSLAARIPLTASK